jgi:trans-2,3-dihydro-3-hydroxyanthranilate isomerase
VPVADLAAVSQVQFDVAGWLKATHHIDGRSVSAFVYCQGGATDGASFHARMFSPAMGIVEDPATGAAVAAMTGALQAAENWADGAKSLLIEQGFEMGRPSFIHVDLVIKDGSIAKASIGGHAVKIASGMLEI